MIVYLPQWLEFAYLELFPEKQIFYNSYEQSILEDEDNYIIIKNINENYEIYAEKKNIIVILNTPVHKPYVENISGDEIVKKLCERFNTPYDKKIINYCEKNEVCPFITVLSLSLGAPLPTKIHKELLPLTTTISTSKYLQSSLWYFFLNKRSNNLFKNFSNQKSLFLYNYFIELEENFGYVNDDLAHVFLLPILFFSY
jgi:hypothetical protein